uniref:Pseudouridylate synthase RPUSD4, mitochondrial n=1 Tax=Parascaris univalens TaxID=6257 RepID=A0A915BN92_PARUN
MKANEDEDDFFGIERITNSPLPRHMLDKSSRKRKIASDVGFIESQYFGELKDDHSSDIIRSEKTDDASFIEQQFFSYTPSALPSIERSAAGINDIKDSVKLTEERVSEDEKTEELDYISQQLLINHQEHNPPSSFTGFEPCSGTANKNAAAEVAARKNDSRRVEITKAIGEIAEEVDFISQHSIDSSSSQQAMSTYSNLNVDSDSTAKQQSLQKRRQEKLDKQKRVVISEPKHIYEEETTGLNRILNLIEPVWKMSDAELVELMCQRVIYEDDDLLAFDKPYQMAYSGSKAGQPQMDRILQNLKASVAPEVQRLCLVKSLDKDLTGVILFAKNESMQKSIMEKYKDGAVEQRYRTIVRGVPEDDEAVINIPLVKKSYKQNFIMRPLMPNSKVRPFHVTTEYRVIKDNGECSSLQCIIRNDISHQVRSHLGLGLGCPIIGDFKYSGYKEFRPPKLPSGTMQRLQLAGNQYRRLPMYLHLSEVSIPVASSGSRTISIRSPLPAFFAYTLRKLRLFKT